MEVHNHAARNNCTHYFRKFLMLFLAVLMQRALQAQEVTIKVGVRDNINCTFLKENRKFIVCLPGGYDKSNETYSVLYLLDGNPYFVSEIKTVAYRLWRDKLVSQMIIVGSEDKDEASRNRVMIPVKSNDYLNPQGENFFPILKKS